MSETVKVISAENPNPWEHGITYYDMVFERNGQPFHCSWGTKGGQPQPGEEVTGEFSQKADGEWKFTKGSKDKPAPSAQGASRESTTGGGRRDWAPESERDPERAARILRQHSQTAALQYLALSEFSIDPVNRAVALEQIVKPIIDWFDQDVNAAGKAASRGAGASAPSHAQASSPATTPAPEKRSTEDIADLEMALNETPSGSFMGAAARTQVAEYMQTQLAPDDLTRACNQLTNKGDQEQQEMTFRAMCKRTERWKGQPLPTAPQPDDEIPF